MATEFPIIPLPPMKGINNKDDITRLTAGQGSLRTNVLINRDGSVQRCQWYADKFAPLPTAAAFSLFEVKRWDGAIEYYFICGDVLFKFDTTPTTPKAVIWGLSASKPMRSAFYGDYSWMGNGFDENKVIVPYYPHKIAMGVVDTADATASASAIALLNDIRAIYNAHIYNYTSLVDSSSSSITFSGTWDNTSVTGCYKATRRRSNTQNDYFEYTFTGTGVCWYGEMGPDQGNAEVYLDGVSQGVVGTYNATVSYQSILFSTGNLPYGTYTLRVNVLHTKPGPSSNYYVPMDFIAVEAVAHTTIDTTNLITAASCTDAATSYTLANELKPKFNAHRSQSGVHPTNDDYHLVDAADANTEGTVVTLSNQLKLCVNQHIGDAAVIKWGITAPTTITLADSTVAGNPNGTYSACYYTFYDKVNAIESGPSPVANVTVTSKKIRWTLEASTNPAVTHKRLYRPIASGSVRYLAKEVANTVLSYDDNETDATIGVSSNASTVEGISVVANCDLHMLHEDRVYSAGDYLQPQRVYYSEVGAPWKHVTLSNWQDFAVAVTAMTTCDNGLVVFERNKTWLWAAPYSAPRMISEKYGCVSPESIARLTKQYFLFMSSYGVCISDGSSEPVLISQLINKTLLSMGLESAAATYDVAADKVYITVA